MSGKLTILKEISLERNRQDEKWGEQNHNNFIWATILGEEYGEACQASFNEWFDPATSPIAGTIRIREELIQVAAVAVAWIEAIERRGS